MRARHLLIASAIAIAAVATVPAVAHHSGAMFDHSVLKKFAGTVKAWQWTNPHSFLTLQTDTGEEKFETGSPNTMFRNGWRMDSFKPGDKVSLYAYPFKDAAPGGMIVTAHTAAGQNLQWLPAAVTADAKVVN